MIMAGVAVLSAIALAIVTICAAFDYKHYPQGGWACIVMSWAFLYKYVLTL